MGRYYKSSLTPIVDYTYKLPYKELFTALEYKQKAFDTNTAKMDKAKAQTLSLKAKAKDKEGQKKVQDKYDSAFDAITKDVGGDMSLANNLIHDLSIDLAEEFTTGKGGAIQNAYNQTIEYDKSLEERLKSTGKDRITREQAKNAKAFSSTRYSGVGDGGEDGRTWNSFNGYDPVNFVNIGETLNKIGNDTEYMRQVGLEMSPDGKLRYVGKKEYLSSAEIGSILRNYLQSDVEAMAYIDEEIMFSMNSLSPQQLESLDFDKMREGLLDVVPPGHPATSGQRIYDEEDLDGLSNEQLFALYERERKVGSYLNPLIQKYDFERDDITYLTDLTGGNGGKGDKTDTLNVLTTDIKYLEDLSPFDNIDEYNDTKKEFEVSLNLGQNTIINNLQTNDFYKGIFWNSKTESWKKGFITPTGDKLADNQTAFDKLQSWIGEDGTWTAEGRDYLNKQNWKDGVDRSLLISEDITSYRATETKYKDAKQHMSDNVRRMVEKGILKSDQVNWTTKTVNGKEVQVVDAENSFNTNVITKQQAQVKYIRNLFAGARFGADQEGISQNDKDFIADLSILRDKIGDDLGFKGHGKDGVEILNPERVKEIYDSLYEIETKYYDKAVQELPSGATPEVITGWGSIKYAKDLPNLPETALAFRTITTANREYKEEMHTDEVYKIADNYLKDSSRFLTEGKRFHFSSSSTPGKNLMTAAKDNLDVMITTKLNSSGDLDQTFATMNVRTADNRSIFEDKEAHKKLKSVLKGDKAVENHFLGYLSTNDGLMMAFQVKQKEGPLSSDIMMVAAPEGTETELIRVANDPSIEKNDAAGILNPVQMNLIRKMRNITNNDYNSGEWGTSDMPVDVEVFPNPTGTGTYRTTYDVSGPNGEKIPTVIEHDSYADLYNWYYDGVVIANNLENTGTNYMGLNPNNGSYYISNMNDYITHATTEALNIEGAVKVDGNNATYSNISASSNNNVPVYAPGIANFFTAANTSLETAGVNLILTDGYRTSAYNNKYLKQSNPNAALNSLHTKGLAADIRSSAEAVAWFESNDALLKQHGIEGFVHGDHIHIEYDSVNAGWNSNKSS